MAFNNLGDVVTLAPGGATSYNYFFVNFADAGAQFAFPDIKSRGAPFGRLVTAFNQAKRKTPNGGVIYSVDMRNEGSGAVSFNLQGGGLAFGLNNFADIATLAPHEVFSAIFFFGSPPRDRGALFLGADIKNNDCQVVALLQGKKLLSFLQVIYSARYQNNGPATAAFNFQGGGFDPGFNNLGDVVTIAPGQSEIYHFYFGLAREDHGAQYAGPDVKSTDAELVALSHSKEHGPFGIDYYVTIRNDGPVAAAYNLQGGSLI
jgi:hypothetical protein